MRFHQRGVTAIGWMIILCLIAFFTLLTLRLAPMYLEYSTVLSALDSVKTQAETERMSTSDIKRSIMANLSINDADNVKPEHITIESKREKVIVTVAYEVRQPMAKQISILGTFDKTVEITMPSR